MAETSPAPDDEQDRRRLFQDVWGDGSRPSSAPRAPRKGRIEEPPAPIGPPFDRIQELERGVRQLQESLESLRRLTEEEFAETRNAMLKLAEAVQAATRKPSRKT